MWRIGQTENLYRGYIQGFLDNEEKFKRFKNHSHYKRIIGEPSAWQGIVWYDLLRKDPDLYKNVDEFIKADSIGGPPVWHYDDKKISSNSFRYMNSINLLKQAFGSLDGKTIFEVGSGWGGLAHCILTQWKPTSYHILDIPEAMDLAVKHSQLLGHTNIQKGQPDFVPDITIAEYSLTEQTDESLYDMTSTLLLPSKNIFVRSNIVDKAWFAKWLGILQTNFELTVMKEEPTVVDFNIIVIGKS